jgi:hypothetical protein
MSFDSVRIAVEQMVQAGWAAAALGYGDIEFENIYAIDHAGRTTPFVTFEWTYRKAEQGSIELAPLTRYDGEACFDIHIPLGFGNKPRATITDAISVFMKYAKTSNVTFAAPRQLRPRPYKGFEITPLRFSFFYKE